MNRHVSNIVLFGFAIVSLTCFGGQLRAAWQTEPVDLTGDAGFSLSIDLDSSGTPHVAYYSGGDRRYAVRGTTGWEQVNVLDNADAFALDDNDLPYFINVVSPEFYPYFNVLLDNNLVLGQKLANTRISEDVFLEFDSQNRPQIGYVDTTAQLLKHTSWTGTSWNTRTVASGPEFRFANWRVVATLDANDQMHFSWSTEADVLKYAKPAGATWQISSPFPTLSANPYDIDVDDSGNVHLAYDVFTGNVFTGGLHYAEYDGAMWNGERVDGLDSFGSGRSKVVADADGAPHIFTYDSTFSGPDQLKHVYLEDGAWVDDLIDSYTGGSSGPDEIEVTLDEAGFHVLYSTGHETIHYAFEALATSLGGDFDLDNDVDGLDFLLWQRDPNLGNLSVWESNYGADLNASLTGASIAVPEPCALALALLAAIGLTSRWQQGLPAPKTQPQAFQAQRVPEVTRR